MVHEHLSLVHEFTLFMNHMYIHEQFMNLRLVNEHLGMVHECCFLSACYMNDFAVSRI